ncbi:MAG: protein-L-isoaspartate O-methyltransferase, partial [Acidobacteria bacterium]
MSLRENEPLEYSAERSRMVQTQLRDRGIRDERVLSAILRIPRHEFVPEDFR